ncbi:hypothetical protein ACRFV7_001791 [Klebsiella oxytoca]|uniref:hypothetical protein n=1 Tax=Klebsiella oxytoca TaxID=571 RepID=UPI00066A9B8B|nr:hypothetical protein [Klebsiella oxytoca]EJA2381545.1 hypothetical protein [Klebsiella oxytoca]EJZ8300668.1 hypothetical protein [Klebsiella oxytoca]EKM0802540.1 hypothetical protein [Klebsiella oxytoca]EKT7901460.1 hypothetical protein [Klebsiella oxytoca]ELI3674543.1 hypothetical protein [Klebsiella oxytoca]
MAKAPFTAEQSLQKIRQVRLCLFLCGLFSLFTALLHIFTRSFNPLYEGVQLLLGVGCVIYGFTLSKRIKQILTGQPG